jgi:diamine N-acetyltransferase
MSEVVRIEIREIDGENFRVALELEVTPEQTAFVASTARYLALCAYGGLWHPLGLYAGDTMVGFAMWAHDPDERSHWIGGFLIDRNQQRRGYGRASILALIEWLRTSQDAGDVALSYAPGNEVAARLYASVGFRETGEREGDEVVARLRA